MREFRIARLGRHGKRHGGDNLAVFQCGREQALEEVVGRDAALVGLHGCAECQQRRRIVRGRIIVGDRAADGAAMAHRGIADQRGEIGQRGNRLLHWSAGGDVMMRRRRLDGQRVTRCLDPDQFLDPGKVDHVRRRGEALLHHGNQRVAACEIFCLLALGEQRRGFVDGGGAMIGGLIHDWSPEFSSGRVFFARTGGRFLKTLLSFGGVDGMPDAVGRRRHFQLVVPDRVRDGVAQADCVARSLRVEVIVEICIDGSTTAELRSEPATPIIDHLLPVASTILLGPMETYVHERSELNPVCCKPPSWPGRTSPSAPMFTRTVFG